MTRTEKDGRITVEIGAVGRCELGEVARKRLALSVERQNGGRGFFAHWAGADPSAIAPAGANDASARSRLRDFPGYSSAAYVVLVTGRSRGEVESRVRVARTIAKKRPESGP